MGLIDTISLYGAAVLAIPIGLLGVEFLLFGDQPVLGSVFLGLALALVAGQYYLPDLKGQLLGGASDVVLGDGDGDSNGDGDGDEGAGDGSENEGGTHGETDTGVEIPEAEE